MCGGHTNIHSPFFVCVSFAVVAQSDLRGVLKGTFFSLEPNEIKIENLSSSES